MIGPITDAEIGKIDEWITQNPQMSLAEKVIGLRMVNTILRQRAKLDTLPKYADTGEAFVPGWSEAWINVWANGACPVSYALWRTDHQTGRGGWSYHTDAASSVKTSYAGPAYSTEAAAEAAKKGSEKC